MNESSIVKWRNLKSPQSQESLHISPGNVLLDLDLELNYNNSKESKSISKK